MKKSNYILFIAILLALVIKPGYPQDCYEGKKYIVLDSRGDYSSFSKKEYKVTCTDLPAEIAGKYVNYDEWGMFNPDGTGKFHYDSYLGKGDIEFCWGLVVDENNNFLVSEGEGVKVFWMVTRSTHPTDGFKGFEGRNPLAHCLRLLVYDNGQIKWHYFIKE